MHVDGPSHPHLDPFLKQTESTQNGERIGDAGVKKISNHQWDPASVRLLHSEISNLPDVRLERVEALQLAIRRGSYQPPSEQIADAMLSELLL